MPERPLKVTILGINYAPESSGIAPYTAGVAEGLRSCGHAVSVVTTFPHYPQWRFTDPGTPWSADDVVAGVSTRRLRHYVPRRPSGARRALSEISFGLRSTFTGWAEPDVVISVSPALLSTAMAALRTSSSRRPLAFGVIMQDIYTLGLAETSSAKTAAVRAISTVEKWAARQADGVAVIHDRFAETVHGHLGIADDRITVIRNWTREPQWPAFDREALRSERGWNGRCVVLHSGAMGDKQDLSNVVRAARQAESSGSTVLFVLLGDGGQRRRLEELAGGCRHLEFVPPVPDAEYGALMRSADVLLVNEGPGVRDMAVPSKLTSYFSTGLPVLAATSDGSTTSQEIAAASAGVRVEPGDPLALLRAAESLGADRVRARRIGAGGPEYCARVLDKTTAIAGYESWIEQLMKRAAIRRGAR